MGSPHKDKCLSICVCVCMRTRGFPITAVSSALLRAQRERERERARVSGARDIRAHRRSDRASRSGLRHILNVMRVTSPLKKPRTDRCHRMYRVVSFCATHPLLIASARRVPDWSMPEKRHSAEAIRDYSYTAWEASYCIDLWNNHSSLGVGVQVRTQRIAYVCTGEQWFTHIVVTSVDSCVVNAATGLCWTHTAVISGPCLEPIFHCRVSVVECLF